MVKKKIMILGASDLQLPAILKCKELGIISCVLDYDNNAIGKDFADIFYNASTLDKEEILKIAIDEKVDGIITLASDRPIPIISEVAQRLNLISIPLKSAEMATNKAAMRVALKEHNVSIPEFYIVKSKNEYKDACTHFTNKFITKPADNSGSRGIYLVESLDQKEHAYEYSMKSSENHCILLEEYMEGPEVSVETFTLNSKVNIIAITDKITTGAPFFVEMGHTQPSQHSEKEKKEISALAKQAVIALGIVNGPSHVEIKLTKNGPKIVEVGARLGGDCIATHLTPLSTGVDLVELTILNSLGIFKSIPKPTSNIAIIRYLTCSYGTIKNILYEKIDDENIFEIHLSKRQGDFISETQCSNDRIGYVIVSGNTLKDAEDSFKRVKEKIKIDIEEV